MNRSLFISVLLSLLFFANPYCAKNIDKGFAALAEFDYFKARKIFYSELGGKSSPAAAYGLATILMKTDNPFHNLDSACKYVNRSFNFFRKNPVPLSAAGFIIDSLRIRKLADTISYKCWLQVKEQKSLGACNHFLLSNYLGRKKLIYDVIYLRDELEFAMTQDRNQSDSTRAFIVTHPQSLFLREALILLDHQLFEEETAQGTKEVYMAFIKKYPRSQMLNSAYEKLFTLHRNNKDVKGLSEFVSLYPLAPQNLDAWKLLFFLSVKSYSSADLKKFIDDYPRFPLKSSILKEMELNNLVLIPVETGDYTGYIDLSGKTIIKAQYDEASQFAEGLAVVSRNDSVFFINKENQNPFNKFFEFATPYKNGIAAVKQGGKAFFINRLGQVVSDNYDDIAELSDRAYIIRKGSKYGAVDQFGQPLLDPQFDKLGDFKNGYAYYVDAGKYGFVSRDGVVHKASYEWIGDFNEDQLAMVKIAGQYGLVNTSGRKVMEPLYDQVLRGAQHVYIVISENQYGFYSTKLECFIAGVFYEYNRELPPVEYTDGELFRLNRKEGAALVDINGKTIIAPGTYEEFGFPSEGLIRVRQKKKFGFTDKRLNTIIPVQFQGADDFADGIALVTLKNKHMMIDPHGNTIYSSESDLKRAGKGLFLAENEAGALLLNKRGETLAQGVEEIRQLDNGTLLLELEGGELKILKN